MWKPDFRIRAPTENPPPTPAKRALAPCSEVLDQEEQERKRLRALILGAEPDADGTLVAQVDCDSSVLNLFSLEPSIATADSERAASPEYTPSSPDYFQELPALAPVFVDTRPVAEPWEGDLFGKHSQAGLFREIGGMNGWCSIYVKKTHRAPEGWRNSPAGG
jgi:hypothetical protein